jgi:hypothetical protein
VDMYNAATSPLILCLCLKDGEDWYQ